MFSFFILISKVLQLDGYTERTLKKGLENNQFIALFVSVLLKTRLFDFGTKVTRKKTEGVCIK